MTEKRFLLFVGNNYGVQTVDGEVIFDSIRSIADADVLVEFLNDLSNEIELLKKENEQLKQELFESEVDYFKETYHDNPIRADDHILELKKEFKERFGRDFEYGEK